MAFPLKCQIKDLGRVVTGHTPPTRERDFYGDQYPLIKPTDMRVDERYIGNTDESLSRVGYEKFRSYLLPPDTPCVVTIGTIGKLCLTKEPSFCNQAVNAILVDKTKHDSMYVYYLMRLTNPRVKALSSGTTSGRENVSKGVFESIEVNIHTLPEQRRIGAILAAYDDLIENNTRRIKILEQIVQMLYREWFVNFLFPGHERVKMVESEQGQIPHTWSALPMDDVVSEILDYRGKTPKKLGSDWVNDGVIALSALNVKHGRLESLDKAKRVDDDLYKRWMKSELDEGDILMTSEAPLGEAYILTQKKKYCLSQRLFAIRANPKRILPSLLYLFLGSHGGQEQIKSRSTGTTVLGIRQSELRKITVPIPEYSLQERLNSVAWPLLKQIDALARKNENLRSTRDLLLPKLVSGEVCVEQIEEEAFA